MIEVPLLGKYAEGQVALIDDEDAWVLGYKWFISRTGGRVRYAMRNSPDGSIRMHREIALRAGIITGSTRLDHINHNGLDSRRENLRPCNSGQNTHARPKDDGKYTSKYRGVSWDARRSRWEMSIKKGNTRYRGRFETEEAAARTYDAKAIELYGSFAQLNFP